MSSTQKVALRLPTSRIRRRAINHIDDMPGGISIYAASDLATLGMPLGSVATRVCTLHAG